MAGDDWRRAVKAALARSERFELPTLGFEVRCSIQLSYERVSVFNDLAESPKALGAVEALKTTGKRFLLGLG